VEELRPGGLATFAGYVKRGGQKKLGAKKKGAETKI